MVLVALGHGQMQGEVAAEALGGGGRPDLESGRVDGFGVKLKEYIREIFTPFMGPWVAI